MRVGCDTFTLRDLRLTPSEQLHWLHQRGLEGAQFGGLRGLSPQLDAGALTALRDQAEALGMYTHVSLSHSCNPHLVALAADEHRRLLSAEIAAAAAVGWHELHASLGGGEERYLHAVPWTQQLADSAAFLRTLTPLLRQHGCRINLETHGDCTTFELVRLIEDLGPDVLGICLDTANVLCHCEDPVLAARRAAPYVHLTHLKDGALFFTDRGYGRQSLPPGRGMLNWEVILPVLAEFSPDLPLSIEDHKWLFYFHCFEPHWLRLHPDLTREELAAVLRLAWRCEEAMRSGRLPQPVEYEQIPHVDEVDARLRAGAAYLQELLTRLGLRDRGQVTRPANLGCGHP
ncbi:MAG: sugar phosphate isomerase/epimerase [Fimbriimonadaceae bacterium]|nr:sugar phosphate isomerase/epimerase [Fimbriimonadaceae bacterium]